MQDRCAQSCTDPISNRKSASSCLLSNLVFLKDKKMKTMLGDEIKEYCEFVLLFVFVFMFVFMFVFVMITWEHKNIFH